MRRRIRNPVLLAAAAFLLVLLPAYLLNVNRRAPASARAQVLSNYLKAVYARDFKRAYRFVSSQDRNVKKETVYVSERGPFTGFAAEVAWKLSQWIEVRPLRQRLEGNRAMIRLSLKLPDANAVGPLLFNWDEERLNALARPDRKKILASLDNLKRDGGLKMIDGEEEFVMIREGKHWKVFLNWAAGVRVRFDTIVPTDGAVEASPAIRETVARSGELFTIAYRVKNQSAKEILARIVHRVEPKALAQYLDLVECALLLPVRILPGEEQNYASTYLVRGDLPDGAKELKVTYEFKVER